VAATTEGSPVTGSRDHRVVDTRPGVRPARWLLLFTTVVVVAACEPAGQAGAATAAALETPGGTQQVWCLGRGPGVVLIDGIGDQVSSRQWLDVQGELAQDARVCRYDRPGTGASPPPTQPRRGPGALDTELDTVVDHTTDGEVVLVAHSFGGYLARLFARHRPERVRGIVFVDALDPRSAW
jgi:pimeloyl-ACP methyl ester carboxylesterase